MIKSMKTARLVSNSIVYAILTIMSIIWLIPIAWVVLSSFRGEGGAFVPYFIPKTFTLDNYIKLFTNDIFPFGRWYANTFIIAIVNCVLNTTMTLSTAFVLSRMRFGLRKTYLIVALVLGMFPGFMSTIAVYYILKALGLTQNLLALILVYAGGAGLNFYISKGFFDTLPRALDEAARLDGANNATLFFKIILPLSKPIIVYTALMSFMAPWLDFVLARIIMGDNYNMYTVAPGLFAMIQRQFISEYFVVFAAGCVCVAIPTAALFMSLQRFYVEGVTGGSVKG